MGESSAVGERASPARGRRYTESQNARSAIGRGGNRTHTSFRTGDFKSPASAIPPRAPWLSRRYACKTEKSHVSDEPPRALGPRAAASARLERAARQKNRLAPCLPSPTRDGHDRDRPRTLPSVAADCWPQGCATRMTLAARRTSPNATLLSAVYEVVVRPSSRRFAGQKRCQDEFWAKNVSG